MLPQPCYVYKNDRTFFRVDNADSMSAANTVTFLPGEEWRNEIGGAYLQGLANTAITLGGTAEYNSTATASTMKAAILAKDDRLLGTAPQFLSRERSEYQFLSAARPLSGTTVSGSCVIAVANTTCFAVGWAITGAGISANSIIQAIDPVGNTITISQQATASGLVTLTVGGAYIVGRCWVDEFSHYSAYPPQLLNNPIIQWPKT